MKLHNYFFLWFLLMLTACATGRSRSVGVPLLSKQAISCSEDVCLKLDLTQPEGKIEVTSRQSGHELTVQNLSARCVERPKERKRATHLGSTGREYRHLTIEPKLRFWSFPVSDIGRNCRMEVRLITTTRRELFTFVFN